MRIIRAMLVFTATVAVLAACGSGQPSPQQANVTASQTRGSVVEEYWTVLTDIQSVVKPDTSGYGNGFFSECPSTSGQPAQQIRYNVTDLVTAPGTYTGQALPTYFQPRLEAALRSHGWGAFSPSGAYLLSKDGKYSLYLKHLTGNQQYLLQLTVSGPCVTVGNTFASQVPSLNGSINDQYPNSDLSARPTPTAPLPTP